MNKMAILLIAIWVVGVGFLSGCTSEEYILVSFKNSRNNEIAITLDIDNGTHTGYFYLDGNSDDFLPSSDYKLVKGETHTIMVCWAYNAEDPPVACMNYTFNTDVLFTVHEDGEITKT